MTVSLKNIADQVLWSQKIAPKQSADQVRKAALDNAI